MKITECMRYSYKMCRVSYVNQNQRKYYNAVFAWVKWFREETTLNQIIESYKSATINTPLDWSLLSSTEAWNFAKYKFIGKYKELVEGNCEVRSHVRSEKNCFENRKFRVESSISWSSCGQKQFRFWSTGSQWCKQTLDVKQNTLAKKKGREKRRGGGRKRERSPSCRKIRSENERTSLPAAISRDQIGPDQIKN